MFSKNFFKDIRSIIALAITTFILLEGLAFVIVVYVKKAEINNYLSITSPDFKTHVDIANEHLTEISKIFYDLKIDNPTIANIMYKASKTKDKEKLSKLRKKLLNKLLITYKYMHKYNVRQLHFQLPQSISFLRFHRPKKYGDSLKNIRETLNYVNEYKTSISAFEEGRIFNGFRNVYPIYKDNKFVGTVEISFSFDAMQEILSKIDSTSYIFMINNKIVDTKVFKDEKVNYERSEFDGYDYDKNTLKNTMQMNLEEIHKINKLILKRVEAKIKKGKLFSIYYKDKNIYDNNSIIISFAPIPNLNNDIVAYIIHYKFGHFVDIILSNIHILFALLTLLSILLSILLSVLILNENKKRKVIYNLAVHDALTGIYNRHGVNEVLNQKLEEFKRDKKDFSVIFFDIDFFKNVNDTYGHDMGDYVLENIVQIVDKEIRTSDIFARWGGEEFIIFLPNTENNQAVNLAEKLRKLIQEHAFSNITNVTCSFGVTQLLEKDTKSSFLKRVDELLYKAKNSGRNIVINN